MINKYGLIKTIIIILKYLVDKITFPIQLFEANLYVIYVKFMARFNGGYINSPYEVINIPPSLIKYSIHPYPENYMTFFKTNQLIDVPKLETIRRKTLIFNKRVRIVGHVKDGDWDLKKEKYEMLVHDKGFKKRFASKEEWQNTVYYKFLLEKNKDLLKKNKIEAKNKINNYLQHCDQLFEEINTNGYKSQSEQEKTIKSIYNNCFYENKSANEVEVGISRNGEILFIDGRRRLSIAKLLDLNSIPVIVNVWHEEYIKKIKYEKNKDKLTPNEAIEPILQQYENF